MRPDSSKGIAIETIVSTLKDPSDGVHEKGAFSWSFGKFAGHLADDVDYEELRANFRAAQSVEDLLREMLASASAAVKSLKPRFDDMANRRKFEALPDEILLIVLEMVYWNFSSDSDSFVTVTDLALVSRRFRNIIVGSPTFWSKISSDDLSLDGAKLYASRVTPPIISLSVYSADTEEPEESERDRILGMYRLMSSISSRINSLTINMDKFGLPIIDRIMETCSNLSFPFLVELSLSRTGTVSRRVQNFCSNWDMPSLDKLHVNDFIPQFSRDTLSKIRTCDIKANTVAKYRGLSLTEDIVAFLLSLTAVQDLCIAAQFSYTVAQLLRGRRMESVKSLTLVLQNKNSAVDDSILDFIEFPSVTSFSLDLGLTDLERLDDILEHIRFRNPPASLTDVTLTVGVEYEKYDGRMPTFMVGEWCKAFKHLNSLTLETKRHNTHGLLSFASAVDAVKVVDFDEDGVDGDLLAELPFVWGYSRPHRTAVMTAEDLGKNRGDNLRFIERNFCDNE
ncbi:hypothetical protein SCHPADRAFT_907086 [Schizopora paradoxa]|uniref:Uncharacterized protein n=1 Tax=Schizopora paradoxa TaxID=27342 RepID=A0A0H2RL86_9AGAM|nr:hypothetical protein SCHPADRAFT_907086 [Schizopora paradoxa]